MYLAIRDTTETAETQARRPQATLPNALSDDRGAQLSGRPSQMRAHQPQYWQALQFDLFETLRSYPPRRHDPQQPQDEGAVSSVHRREDILAKRRTHETYESGPS